jgi:uncharacterized protein
MSSHGQIEHIEFPADDVERAKSFYSAVFGWSFREMPGMPEYFLFGSDGGRGGAIGKRNVNTPNAIRLYVTVDSVDAAIAAAEANGGRVVEPKDAIPEMGLWAVIADSEGNEVGLYEAAAA